MSTSPLEFPPSAASLAAGDAQTAALSLAEEMLVVAERWDVPGHTGSSLAVLGVVTGESGD